MDSSDKLKQRQVDSYNKKSKKSKNNIEKNDGDHLMNESDDKAEYDFMSTQEGINAKLDLARAYIAMEDKAAALQTLKEILSSGNQEQQNHAQQLMAELG